MATSYNGWPASPDKHEIDVVVFGDAAGFPFPGGARDGDVWAVLGYVATQLHERVEECVTGWCWGYTYKQNVNNPSELSCHASGTAIDWNAPSHPNGSSGTFSDAQVGTIYAILNEVQGTVRWLQGYDEMHFEICVDAATLARVAAGLPAAGPAPEPTPPPAPAPEDDMPTILGGTDRNSQAVVFGDQAIVMKDSDSIRAFSAAGSPTVQVTGRDYDQIVSRLSPEG